MKNFNISDSLKNYLKPYWLVNLEKVKHPVEIDACIKTNLKIDRPNEPSSVTLQIRFPILSSGLVNRNFLYTIQFCSNNETQRNVHDNNEKYETKIM